MAVTFTSAKALLVAEATALSAEATAVGLTSLATALTNLATEIDSSSVTEDQFFGNGSSSYSVEAGGGGSGSNTLYGSASNVWVNILQTSANIIKAKNSTTFSNEIAPDDSTTLKTIIAEIPQALESIEIQQRVIADQETIMSNLAKGTGIHMTGPLDWVGLISTYRIYVEIEGPDKMTLEQFKAYYDKIKALPRDF